MSCGLFTKLWNKIKLDGECWIWQEGLDKDGYPNYIRFGGKRYRPHRLVYELYIGELDLNLTIDHLCRNKICIRPEHLEQVSAKVNGLRGNTYQGINSRKIHCTQGHPYDKKNTYYRSDDGSRVCKICAKVWQRNRREKLYAKIL